MNTKSSKQTIVIKIGGSTLGEHDTSLRDIAKLINQGKSIVVVHGGGSLTTEWMERLGVPTTFVGGLRKTTPESLDVATAVLAGLVNKKLIQEFSSLGVPALGISGADAQIIRSPLSNQGLGLVGENPVCDTRPIEMLLREGFLPLIAPIGISTDNQLININADAVAGAVSLALKAEALIMLTNTSGVLGTKGESLDLIDQKQANALIDSKVIADGMLPKLFACQTVAAKGITARIVDGRISGAVVAALKGEVGTLIK